jgi:uncharacterized protein
LDLTMPPPRTATRLDPRAPFVLDSRELGRRPGSMREVARSVPAPDSWSLPLVEVPAGTPIELELRLESVMEGVLVTGTATTEVQAECGRCLEAVTIAVRADLQELFGYQPDPQDEEAPVVTGDLLDLEPLVHDAVVLALPLNPVCDEACAGLCPGCGEPFARLEPGHAHDQLDPRWAALAALHTDQTSADTDSPRPTEI